MKTKLSILFLLSIFSCTYTPPTKSNTASSSSTSSSGEILIDGGGGNGGFGTTVSCYLFQEICNGFDDDCNGLVDDLTIDSNSVCGYEFSPYWVGSHDGVCNYGYTACIDGKLNCVYTLPVTEMCGDMLDNDCDQKIDENCSCNGTEITPCYSGNPSVIGTGVCKWGTSACDNGINDGVCVNFIPQSTEICNQKDDDCDGKVDNVIGGCQ